MSLLVIFKLLGSLALLMFGMKSMSEALQKMAGPQLRHVLGAMTTNRFTGMLTGMSVTAAVQSSTATTLMTVSFVNAGLLTLVQAISVIMGANIGTTLTAWIMSLGMGFNISDFVYPAFFLGIILIYMKKRRLVGDFLFGVAFLFLGLATLKETGFSLVDSPESKEAITAFFAEYAGGGFMVNLLFLVIGTILTLCVQSSAAIMAITMMLCSTGMKATPSDVGDWVLNGRHATWCIFPKWGNSYARYWTRINSSIAFHSPIYTAVSNSAMKISSYNKLGQRASHGCIRLAVWDAKWIYDNVGAGTVVSIVEGMAPDPELRDALKLPPLDKKYCTPISTPMPTAEPDYSLDNVPQLGKRQLKEKSEGEDVFWLQQTLKDLGYYDTKVTGKMLKKTVNAVKAFQQDHGLKANGGVTQELMDLIAETARAAQNPQETPAPIATPAP